MTREETIKKAQELLESGALSKEAANAIKKDLPELSESEDEKIRKGIIRLIMDVSQNAHFLTEYPDLDKWVYWLEKQKPLSTEETELNSIAFLGQLGYTCVPPGAEQKPAGWSEEDEKELDSIICDAEQEVYPKGEDLIFLKNLALRLKSLHNRFAWKPSEVQMAVLNRYTEDAPELDSLYEQLKKLI